MAAHDGIPHEIIPPGTTLYRCEAQPGDVVVIHAMGRFRVARVLRVGPKRARLIHPAANPEHTPHHPTRPRTEVYALVGNEAVGVVAAGARGRYGHTLAAEPAGPTPHEQSRSSESCAGTGHTAAAEPQAPEPAVHATAGLAVLA
jgi:hypothetical protein